MVFFEWTWPNACLVGYFALLAPVTFIGQSKAEEGPVVWSKFAIGRSFTYPCTARVGMLCKYLPPLTLIGVRASLGYPMDLTTAMVGIHFTKRALEVLFVHSFSGSPTEDLRSSFLIGMYYTIQSWCYYKDGVGASELSLGLGLGIFCVGIVGNLWHHVLLAKLRKPDGSAADPLIRVEGASTAAVTDSTGKYKIPEGGLFPLRDVPTLPVRNHDLLGHCIGCNELAATDMRFQHHALPFRPGDCNNSVVPGEIWSQMAKGAETHHSVCVLSSRQLSVKSLDLDALADLRPSADGILCDKAVHRTALQTFCCLSFCFFLRHCCFYGGACVFLSV